MKKTMIILVFAFCAFTSSSFADEGQTSAPVVVAPAQPANTQNVNATTAAPADAQLAQPKQSLFGMAMPFVIMLAVMYFLMIRPQQKKMKEHQSMMGALKNGDEVITSSGIIGTIQGMSDKVVTLEVSKNVSFKILKSQINQVVKGQIQDLKA